MADRPVRRLAAWLAGQVPASIGSCTASVTGAGWSAGTWATAVVSASRSSTSTKESACSGPAGRSGLPSTRRRTRSRLLRSLRRLLPAHRPERRRVRIRRPRGSGAHDASTATPDASSIPMPSSRGKVTRYEKGLDRPPPEMCYVDYGLSVWQRRVIEEMVPAGGVADLASLVRRSSAGQDGWPASRPPSGSTRSDRRAGSRELERSSCGWSDGRTGARSPSPSR